MSTIILQSREEWLEARGKGIGASDAGSILGVNKWKSNVYLWEEKVGRRKATDISGKPYVQYGHDAEPHLRALFALDHPELAVTYDSPYKIIRSDTFPAIFCSPDGELEELETGRRGGLEIKTTEINNSRQWDEWKGRIPDQYYCQVCHQMLAAGWEFVWLRAQIKWTTKDGEKRVEIRDYSIEREEVLDDLEALLEAEKTFWACVENKTQPPLRLPEI